EIGELAGQSRAGGGEEEAPASSGYYPSVSARARTRALCSLSEVLHARPASTRLREILGHRTLVMTQRYVRLNAEPERQAVDGSRVGRPGMLQPSYIRDLLTV